MMMVGGIFLVAFVVSVVLTPRMRQLALRWRILDWPNRRKIHHEPIPRLGGIAVYLGWLIALGAALWCPVVPIDAGQLIPMFWAGTGAMLLGLWDDWKDLPGETKLLGQVVLATLLFGARIRIDRLTNPFGGEWMFPGPLSYVMTVLWVVGMMNALNLIDGIDGLAAGVAGISALALTVVGMAVDSPIAAMMLAALAGGCFGFLRYNFPPATIFLGDNGSQFLGFVFASASLIGYQYKSATAVVLLIPLTVLILPVYDMVLAFVRRLRGHRSVFRPDRYHLHHRLLKMGMTPRQAVLFLYLGSAYLSVLAFPFILIPERYAVLLLALLALGLTMAMQTLRFIEATLRRRSWRRLRHRAA